jgi:hypothetical protein
VVLWIVLGIGFYSLFECCLRAEMSLRCRQKFPGKERCLLDHLSPSGTSWSPSSNSHLSIVTLTAVRDRDNKVYSVTASCWQGAMKGPAASGLTTRGVVKGTMIVSCFHLHL